MRRQGDSGRRATGSVAFDAGGWRLPRVIPSPLYAGERERVRGFSHSAFDVRGSRFGVRISPSDRRTSNARRRTSNAESAAPAPHPRPLPRVRGRGGEPIARNESHTPRRRPPISLLTLSYAV